MVVVSCRAARVGTGARARVFCFARVAATACSGRPGGARVLARAGRDEGETAEA